MTIKSLKTKTIQSLTGFLLLAGAATWAQSPTPVVTPGAAVRNLGTVALAGTPATATLTFTFSTGGTQTAVYAPAAPPGTQGAAGLALDRLGNLLVADPGNNQVLRVDFSDPPDLAFASTAAGMTRPDSPQTVTVMNIGNAGLTIPVPAAGADPVVPADWALDAASTLATTTHTSGAPGVLPAASSATLAIDFTPLYAGPAQGSLVLADTALNAAGPGPREGWPCAAPPPLRAGTCTVTVTAVAPSATLATVGLHLVVP